MSSIGSAFLLLTRRAGQSAAAGAASLTTRLCAVTQAGLPQLLAQLQEATQAPLRIADDGVRCTLAVGPDVSAPLTIIGACEARGDEEYRGEDNIVVHSPGLPGGFVVPRQELLRCRAHISGQAAAATQPPTVQPSLGSLSLMEAVNAHFAAGAPPTPRSILDAFYTRARRRHFSLAGMTQLLHRGAQLHADALQLDFPYQCGGTQATKRYLDITPEVADVFGGVEMRHGAKVLTRYGVAVSVGVADHLPSVATPALLWHPSGAPAACLAPLLHGCALLHVGAVSLDYNGPVPGSPLTVREDPRRYMKLDAPGGYDDSVWLTEGIFGVKPGDAWTPSSVVVGVGYSEETAEMELYVRDNATGAVTAAADI